MKSITKVLSIIVMLVVSMVASLAQTTVVPSQGYDPDVPIIPVETVIKGRQAIVDLLVDQTDLVTSYLNGDSVVGQWAERSRWLELNQLQALGYTHRGVFDELSTAISRVFYGADVIKLPSGFYDVRVDVELRIQSARGGSKPALRGSGWLDIREDEDGELSVSEFQPWVYFQGQFGVSFGTNDVTAARWLKGSWGSEDLNVYRDENGNSIVLLDDRMLENGTLAVVVNERGGQRTHGINLGTGAGVKGKDIFTRIGTVRTGEYAILRNVTTIDTIEGVEFYPGSYEWDTSVYGRVPTIELVLDQAFTGKVGFTIPVWGSQRRIAPSRLIVIPKVPVPGLVVGQEYTIPFDSAIGLLPGVYHIRSDFEGVKDPSQDEYGGRG